METGRPEPSGETWDDVEAVVGRFAQIWLSGRRPSVRSFLKAAKGHPQFMELAYLLARTDLNQRLLAGDDPPLEELLHILEKEGVYLDRAQRLQLIRLEYDRRWWRGEPGVSFTEYQIRFPDHRDSIAGWTPLWTCPKCKREDIPLPDEGASTATCPNEHCPNHNSPVTIADVFCGSANSSQAWDTREYSFDEQEDLVGEGGMGGVYRSRDPGLGRELAIKVIRQELHGNREGEWRFVHEAQITSRLEHPNIVPVHSIGRLRRNQRLFYTMKLVRGQTLGEKLAACGSDLKKRLDACLDDFERVCQAVAYAHQRGVIHRDLKPSNIMVGEFGQVQVMDWGLAKNIRDIDRDARIPPSQIGEISLPRDVITKQGRFLGTLLYAAPEQARGETERVGPSADVFALGAIFCEILTGCPPYIHSSDNLADVSLYGRITELIMGQSEWPGIERLSKVEAERSSEFALIQLAKECLARDPLTRPKDAGMIVLRIADYQAATRQDAENARINKAKLAVERVKTRLAISLGIVLFASALFGSIAAVVFRKQSNENATLAKKEEAARESAEFQSSENRTLADANGQLANERARLLVDERRARTDAENRLLTTLAQNLATHVTTGTGEEYRQDELRTLLALQSYTFYRRGKGTGLVHIDGALRKVLGEPQFVTTWHAHEVEVHACGINSSGTLIASVGIDESVCLWDLAQRGIVRKQLQSPSTAPLNSEKFSGKVYFTETNDVLVVVGPKRVQAWRLPSGDALPFPVDATTSPVASFDVQRNLLAVESDDSVLLYRISQQGLERLGKYALGTQLRALAVQPGGSLLAALDTEGIIRIADRSKPDLPIKEIKTIDLALPRRGLLFSIDGFLDFTPDGSHLLSAFGAGLLKSNASQESPVKLPQLEDRALEAKLKDSITVPSNVFQLAGLFEGDIKIWDASELTAPPRAIPHTGILSWSISEDGRWLAVASALESIHNSMQRMGSIDPKGPQAFWLYDLQNHGQPPRLYRGDVSQITAVGFGALRNTQVVTGNMIGEIRLREQPQGIEQLLSMSGRKKTNVARLGSENRLLVSDDTILALHTGTSQLNEVIRLYPNDRGGIRRVDGSSPPSLTERLAYHVAVEFIATSSSPSRFFTTDILRHIQEWDLDKLTCTSFGRLQSEPIFIALSRDGRRLVAITGPNPDADYKEGEVQLWTDTSQKEHVTTLPGRWVSADFDPSCKLLATTDRMGKTAIWEIGKSLQEPIVIFEESATAPQIRSPNSGGRWTAFLNDGKSVAACSNHDSILLWNIESQTLDREFLGCTDIVNALCVSPKDDVLAAICDDGNVRLWTLNGPDEGCLQIASHRAPGRRVSFDATGSRIFACWEDGSAASLVVLSEDLAVLAARRVRRNLTKEEWKQYVGADLPYEKTIADLP